ncbi:MAG TPA: ABC transporter permease [Thermotogota bacterium]|nr:ABC transporter permease [Thermotogota bacterium]
MTIKIEKRLSTPKYLSIVVPIISVFVALLIMFIILTIFFMGRLGSFAAAFSETCLAYQELISWPFFNQYGLYSTISKMVPLAFVALGLSFAYKMKIWNIGGEGQLYMGAMAATWAALFLFRGINSPLVLITLVAIFSAIAGALWALIPALMKAYAKTDEIVVTLMLNYVAIFWVDYLVYGPWRDPKGFGFPGTAAFGQSAMLPTLFDGNVHIGVFIAIALAIVLEYINRKTRWGFNSQVVGDNVRAATYSGIKVKSYTIISLVVSGAIAGLGGGIQMMGMQHRLMHGFSPGYGYTAIIVAWLGKLNPIAIIFVSFLFGGLLVGNDQLQMFYKLPISLISIFQGLVLFCLLGGEAIAAYRLRLEKAKEVPAHE